MTKLRKRMLDDMQLKGFSERTQECYLRSVRQLAQYYHKSPDRITEEELRQYFLHVKDPSRSLRAGFHRPRRWRLSRWHTLAPWDNLYYAGH